MQKKRTDVDFSGHIVEVTHVHGTNPIEIHYLRKPGTVTESVKFINVEGVCVVTGDYGNWLFCREFVPSKDGSVSDGYWCEKMKISSTQDPYEFDSEVAQKEIKDLLLEGHEFSEEEKEWLSELSDAAEEGEWAYHAKAMDRPGSCDPEMIPRGKRTAWWLQVVFDAFDEICRRMKSEDNKE